MDGTVGIEPTSANLGDSRFSSSVPMAVRGGHDPQPMKAVALSRRTPVLRGSRTLAEGRRIERPALRPPSGSNRVADHSAVPSVDAYGESNPFARFAAALLSVCSQAIVVPGPGQVGGVGATHECPAGVSRVQQDGQFVSNLHG